jgi:hypothetical protein
MMLIIILPKRRLLEMEKTKEGWKRTTPKVGYRRNPLEMPVLNRIYPNFRFMALSEIKGNLDWRFNIRPSIHLNWPDRLYGTMNALEIKYKELKINS